MSTLHPALVALLIIAIACVVFAPSRPAIPAGTTLATITSNKGASS